VDDKQNKKDNGRGSYVYHGRSDFGSIAQVVIWILE
jgi:hypothetical protein